MQELEHWYAEGRQLRCAQGAIFLREQGTGPALLLVHGFPTSSWDWAALWPSLASTQRVLAPDLLGFGRSSRPPGQAYRIAEQADLLLKVLKQSDVRRCHLLAHDYGNTVAQELLARAVEGVLPVQIESVVFLNGGLFPECHRPVLLQRLLLSPLGPLLARLTSKKRFAANMRRIFGPATPPSDRLIEGFWTLLQEDGGIAALPALLRYIPERHAQRERWVGALQRTQVPIGFINGSADPISGAHMAARWRALLGDEHLVELPGIGHYPQLESPPAVLEAYRHLRGAFSRRSMP